MTQRCSGLSIADSSELRAVHARLRATWGPGLDDGQTPCCYVLSRNHILLRALEKLLELESFQFQRKLKGLWPSCVVAFSDGKPGSTFPENAPGDRRGLLQAGRS